MGSDSYGGPKEPCIRWGVGTPIPQGEETIFGVVRPTVILCCVYAKTAEPIEMPFGGLTHMGPINKHVLYVVKVGRIHSPPLGVTRRRYGLSLEFFDYLILVFDTP